jgi:hypothetical protein
VKVVNGILASASRSYRRSAAAIALALFLLPADAHAWRPGSGDVDQDGRATTHDAVLIMESMGWPAATRARLRAWLDACDINRDGQCDTGDAFQIYLASVTDWNDVDGDGVANDADCAPFDSRLATPHTYYVDLDQDHFGDANQKVAACTIAAKPPLVVWDGDPNDHLPSAVHLPVAKGSRMFGVDLTDLAEAGTWRPELARELGIDSTSLKIDWNLIETAPGVYSGPQVHALTIAASLYSSLGLSVSLSVNPISRGHLVLPPDLRAEVEAGRMRLSDPRVINRFKDVLTFVRGALGGLPLASLQLGYEVDRFLSRANVPGYFWADYGELVVAGSQHAKGLWGAGLQTAVTATHVGLTGPAADQMRAINSLVDVVSATYVAPATGITGVDPASLRVELQRLIVVAYPKKLHLQAVEYPSAPVLGGSETRQSQFLRAVFDVWDEYGYFIPFVSFGALHDRSPASATTEAQSLFGLPAINAAAFASSGLRSWSGEGRSKTAYRTLRNLAFERGWWRVSPPQTRSFEMGFTPSLFDAPSDAPTYVAMLDWIYDTVRTEGSFFNLHLDSGVPWVEAAVDNLTSPALPYSPHLRTSWEAHKARIPAGHSLLVSVNPTGVPRDQIAPYFGVGEGFTYNEQFERVGDGVIADYENRLPPPPWNTHPLDHPDVKLAFTNYCRRVIQYFSPTYLVIAIETTATMHEDPNAYAQLVSLIQHVHGELKARPETRDVQLLVSLSATSFMTDEYGVALKVEEQGPLKRELQIQGMLDIAPYVDGFALSFYPHYSKWNSTFMLASMFDELWSALALAGKPVGFSESGWPAESFDVLGFMFFSDAEKQARFVRLTIAEAERAPLPVRFLVNFRTRDGDLQWLRMREWSQQEPPLISAQFVEFYKYFRDIGLFDGDGNVRPALAVWREHFARPYQPKP